MLDIQSKYFKVPEQEHCNIIVLIYLSTHNLLYFLQSYINYMFTALYVQSDISIHHISIHNKQFFVAPHTHRCTIYTNHYKNYRQSSTVFIYMINQSDDNKREWLRNVSIVSIEKVFEQCTSKKCIEIIYRRKFNPKVVRLNFFIVLSVRQLLYIKYHWMIFPNNPIYCQKIEFKNVPFHLI